MSLSTSRGRTAASRVADRQPGCGLCQREQAVAVEWCRTSRGMGPRHGMCRSIVQARRGVPPTCVLRIALIPNRAAFIYRPIRPGARSSAAAGGRRVEHLRLPCPRPRRERRRGLLLPVVGRDREQRYASCTSGASPGRRAGVVIASMRSSCRPRAIAMSSNSRTNCLPAPRASGEVDEQVGQRDRAEAEPWPRRCRARRK